MSQWRRRSRVARPFFSQKEEIYHIDKITTSQDLCEGQKHRKMMSQSPDYALFWTRVELDRELAFKSLSIMKSSSFSFLETEKELNSCKNDT